MTLNAVPGSSTNAPARPGGIAAFADSPPLEALPDASINTNRIFDVLTSFQRAAALRAAIELDLFTAIAAGHTTAESLATACRAATRGVRILADYLVVNGFLLKQAWRYALTRETAAYLDRNSRTYVGDTAGFVQSPQLWAQFGDLTARVRNGGAPLSDAHALAPDDEFWIRFAHGMGRNAAPAAEALVHMLLPALPSEGPLRILDVAAGHGMYGLAFARLLPRAQVTAQDWPAVLQVARHNARQAGVENRFSALPGNAFEIDLAPSKAVYHLVILANFLHHFDAADGRRILQKIHAVLAPGGIAATLEFAPNDDRVSPPVHAAFAIFALATTPAGDAHTVNDIAGMYASAGFERMQAVDIPGGLQRVIFGWKAR